MYERQITKKGSHGDVNLIRVDLIGENPDLSKMKKLETNVLAYGEVSGHLHALDTTHDRVFEMTPQQVQSQNKFAIYEDANGQMYLKVNEPTPLSHQEHFTHTVMPGVFRVSIARQVNPFTQAIEPVKD